MKNTNEILPGFVLSPALKGTGCHRPILWNKAFCPYKDDVSWRISIVNVYQRRDHKIIKFAQAFSLAGKTEHRYNKPSTSVSSKVRHSGERMIVVVVVQTHL